MRLREHNARRQTRCAYSTCVMLVSALGHLVHCALSTMTRDALPRLGHMLDRTKLGHAAEVAPDVDTRVLIFEG